MKIVQEWLHIVVIVIVSILGLNVLFQPKREMSPVGKSITRVVSLSPSITRQIVDLDAEDVLVGVSTFQPPLTKKVEVVSSIVFPDIERIFMLKPDCVLFMSDDVIAHRAVKIASLGIPLYVFGSVKNFSDISKHYFELAQLLGKSEIAKRKMVYYERILREVSHAFFVRCVFFLSHDPHIVAGRKSFINEIIQKAGGINVFSDVEISYPIVSMEQVIWRRPKILITMVPNGERILKQQIEAMKIQHGERYKIVEVTDEHIPYYTPKDYCESVKLFASLLSGRTQAQ